MDEIGKIGLRIDGTRVRGVLGFDMSFLFVYTKLRKNTMEPVKVYSFIQYQRVMLILQEYFRECAKTEWYPLSFCMKYMDNRTEKGQRISKLVEYLGSNLKSLQSGERIPKMQLKQDLQYKRQSTLGDDLKNGFVVSVLTCFGVDIVHHYLIKNERGWSDGTNQKKVG